MKPPASSAGGKPNRKAQKLLKREILKTLSENPCKKRNKQRGNSTNIEIRTLVSRDTALISEGEASRVLRSAVRFFSRRGRAVLSARRDAMADARNMDALLCVLVLIPFALQGFHGLMVSVPMMQRHSKRSSSSSYSSPAHSAVRA